MSESSGLRSLSFPPSHLLESACTHIVAAHAAEVPDLTRLVVLVPNLQARQRVAGCLRLAARSRVVLLPRITTLRAWAEELPVDRGVSPPAAREALLYQALSTRRWFEHADLWAIAAELAALFDELTRWHVGMPASLADFQIRLERAYRARAGASFAFEARMVYELWHALGRDADRLDSEAAYQLRLGALAERTQAAIHAIGLDPLAPSERQFLECCAERAAVVSYVPSADPRPDLTPIEHALVRAWPEHIDEPLAQRAAELRSIVEAPALCGRVTFFGAHGIEQEARAIDLAVRSWLHAGRQAIGVVVLDRLTARRARALLERAEVLVRDEAGWAFSTTSAATVISRWFDACANDFMHRDLLDLLKSPFVFAAWGRARRQAAVWRLEQSIRRESVRAGLDNYLALCRAPETADGREMLHAMQRATRAFERRRRKTLSDWLASLEAAMHEIGVVAGLEVDAAGVQLLGLLQSLAADLAGNTMPVGFGEFRRWMGRRLESATFRDAGIESPVVFTSLAGVRLRRFDAVLVCGADDTHLGGVDVPGLFFNQNVRRELGLPGQAQAARELEVALISLIAVTPEVCVTWQHTRDGDPNLLAPALERLRTLHTLAWGDALDDAWIGGALRAGTEPAGTADAAPEPTGRPAPVVPAADLPAAISASGYNALMACPYRFFAQYVLRLREPDDVQEDVEKSDYGNLLHAVLHRFHSGRPVVSDLDVGAAHADLLQISRAVFADAITMNYLARAWLMRWEKLVPTYLEWQREREAQGWRFRAGEVSRTVVIDTPAGRRFELRGRIDRVDVRRDGAVCVLDYKTRDATKLREALKAPGEDVQLSVYQVLWSGVVDEAAFVALDGKRVVAVEQEGDLSGLAEAVRTRFGDLLDRISDGHPLPAQGTERTCSYCDVGGLCRRKHWA